MLHNWPNDSLGILCDWSLHRWDINGSLVKVQAQIHSFNGSCNCDQFWCEYYSVIYFFTNKSTSTVIREIYSEFEKSLRLNKVTKHDWDDLWYEWNSTIRFPEIDNHEIAHEILLDYDMNTCTTFDSLNIYSNFETIKMGMIINSSLELTISGYRLPCELHTCNDMFPLLLYHEEFSTASCDGHVPFCSRYKQCALLSQVPSTVVPWEQCSYRCTCNHSSVKNCHNFLLLLDRRIATLHSPSMELCDIRANIVP